MSGNDPRALLLPTWYFIHLWRRDLLSIASHSTLVLIWSKSLRQIPWEHRRLNTVLGSWSQQLPPGPAWRAAFAHQSRASLRNILEGRKEKEPRYVEKNIFYSQPWPHINPFSSLNGRREKEMGEGRTEEKKRQQQREVQYRTLVKGSRVRLTLVWIPARQLNKSVFDFGQSA